MSASRTFRVSEYEGSPGQEGRGRRGSVTTLIGIPITFPEQPYGLPVRKNHAHLEGSAMARNALRSNN